MPRLKAGATREVADVVRLVNHYPSTGCYAGPVSWPVHRFATPRDPATVALVQLLCVLLVADQLLLWTFLGLSAWIAAAAAVPLLALGAAAIRRVRLPCRRTAAICLLVSAAVFLLGGEGRLVYANTDWQVRAAVLRDLALNPWPFVYDVRATPDLLRAPLGMYLLPAAAGKLLGYPAAEWLLFVQNTGFLTLLLLLGCALFDSAREKSIALAVFLLFSGLDLLAQLKVGQPLLLSSERWNVAVFTAHLAQAFAVPQHALAGWAGALLFLLWQRGRLSLAGFLAPVPLLALWSPLAVIGVVPFAALAGVSALTQRRLRAEDVALPALTLAFAVPSLLYLGSGSDAVGGGSARITLAQWTVFEMIEVVPYLVPLALLPATRFGRPALAVTALVLLGLPFLQVGQSNDLVMRASIPALAVLALSVGDVLARRSSDDRPLWRGVLIVALTIGAATPAFEIVRALAYPRSPAMRCSYFGVVPGGANTYVVPLARVSPLVAPDTPAMIRPADPSRCWDTPWPNPLYRDFPERVAPEDRDERL